MRTAAAGVTVALGCIAACGREPDSTSRSIAPSQVVLTLSTQGEGVIQGLAADCRGSCTEKMAIGGHVLLRAAPDPGATFAGWIGACSAAITCDLTLDSDLAVTAVFVRAQAIKRLATVVLEGQGRVISSPPRIDCGTVCAALFDDGQPVTLIAMADAGHAFAGWSGACSGMDPCTFTMVGTNATVTAKFAPASSLSPPMPGQ